MSSIRLEGVVKQYGNLRAIDDLDLEIKPGEFFCLLGPSGCGKTTTMRSITGLEKPQSGRIWIGDRLVFDGASNVFVPTAQRNVGMVFQNYALWPHMTVRDNILFGLKIKKMARDEQSRRLDRILDLLQISKLADRFPGELSGGQQQRVALARELVTDAEILVMDEPLSNLDAQLRIDMRFELKRLHEETGKTFVYITHDQIEAMTLSSRMAVMRDGKIRQLDTPTAVYATPLELFVATFIGSGSVGINQLRVVHSGPWLESDGLRIAAPAGLGDGNGRELIIAVRPEEAELHPDNHAEGIACKIAAEMPMGHETLVHVELPTKSGSERPVFKVLEGKYHLKGVGQLIQLKIPPSALHLYDAVNGQRVNLPS